MNAPDLAGARIAIVMLTAIGDVVHTLPVVNSLRAAAPGCRITWIIQPAGHGLVANHPAVDEFILFDRKAGWRAFRDLRATLAGRRFDLVLSLQVYLKAGLITGLLRAPRKLGYDRARARDANWLFTTERVPAEPRGHIQDEYFAFLRHLGVEPRLEWGIGPTEEERARYVPRFPRTDRPVVSMVLGTSKPAKEWPAERYAALIDRLADELGVHTLLVGGRSERELAAAAAIRSMTRNQPEDALEWDLRKLAAFLERSDVVVSPDTGPLHMAVALGTPTVSLMGYTNPARVGPYRFHDLMVDAFGDPGEAYTAADAYRPGRMDRITPDMVFDKVALALRTYPSARERLGQGPPAR